MKISKKKVVTFVFTLVVFFDGLYPSNAFSRIFNKQRIDGMSLSLAGKDYIYISPGRGMCFENEWNTKQPLYYYLLQLDSLSGYFYIYVNEQKSTYSDLVLYDTVASPEWNSEKSGWYRYKDRCIGVVWSPSGEAIVAPFVHKGRNKYILRDNYVLGSIWLDNLSDIYSEKTVSMMDFVPVNSKAIYLRVISDVSNDEGKCLITIIKSGDERIIFEVQKESGSRVASDRWIQVDLQYNDIMECQRDGMATFEIQFCGYQLER